MFLKSIFSDFYKIAILFRKKEILAKLKSFSCRIQSDQFYHNEFHEQRESHRRILVDAGCGNFVCAPTTADLLYDYIHHTVSTYHGTVTVGWGIFWIFQILKKLI